MKNILLLTFLFFTFFFDAQSLHAMGKRPAEGYAHIHLPDAKRLRTKRSIDIKLSNEHFLTISIKKTEPLHQAAISAITSWRDTIAIAGLDGKLALCNEHIELISYLQHETILPIINVTTTIDNTLISTLTDGSIYFWPRENVMPIIHKPSDAPIVSLTRVSHQTIAAAGQDGSLHIFDTNNYAYFNTIVDPKKLLITGITFLGPMETLIAYADGKLEILHHEQNIKTTCAVEFDNDITLFMPIHDFNHQLFAIAHDTMVSIVNTEEELIRMDHKAPITAIEQFDDKDTKLLIFADCEGNIHLWDRTNYKQLAAINICDHAITALRQINNTTLLIGTASGELYSTHINLEKYWLPQDLYY